AMAVSPSNGTAFAGGTGGRPAIDKTTVFASVTAPVHPFCVAVDTNSVYISTSAGDSFTDPATGGHLNSDGERIFAYDKDGNLVNTTYIATSPNSDMGLFGLAIDG